MLWIQSGHDILAFVWEPWAWIICSRKDGKRVNQNVSYSPRLKNVLKELSTGLQLGICWSSTCITTDKSMSSSTLPIRLTVTASHKHYCTRFFLFFFTPRTWDYCSCSVFGNHTSMTCLIFLFWWLKNLAIEEGSLIYDHSDYIFGD